MNMAMKSWDSDYSTRGRLWGGGVRNLPDLPAGTRVLELGCGDGKTLSAMPRGWRIAALDISLPALRLCSGSHPQSDLILANAERLPFKSESFDGVFAYHVAGHLFLPGRRALADEVSRVLKSGGRLFFRDFGCLDMRMGEGQEVEEATFLRGAGIITHYFTESETSELFCRLVPASIESNCWKMRVRGRDLVRSQIGAIFLKN
jgi:SAM-dependent methyltransferase